MKPKILVTRETFEDVLDYLAQHLDVSANQSDEVLSPAALAAGLAGKAGALTALNDRIDATLLKQCPTLKAVCNVAVGHDNIDLDACRSFGVMATNTPDVLDEAAADLAWALILATARRLNEAQAWLREGHWTGWKLKQFLGLQVSGATLGIVGMGRIGQAVARRAKGFGMKILYHNRHRLERDVEAACGGHFVPLDELLEQSEIVSIHTPYSPSTHHLIGAAELGRMKKGSLLIHTARGGVVDDDALVLALKAGRLAGAGLDVYEGEPNFAPELLTLGNVVLTPHIASATMHTRRRMATLAAENLVAALTTGRPPNLLNP